MSGSRGRAVLWLLGCSTACATPSSAPDGRPQTRDAATDTASNTDTTSNTDTASAPSRPLETARDIAMPATVASAVSVHCGSCHDSTRSDNQTALQVFDIIEPRWASSLPADAWHEFAERLLPKVDESTRILVERFVATRTAATIASDG